eukprot:COSAG06_NODE_22_length_33148_cov_102.016279_6_plen_52_part_00
MVRFGPGAEPSIKTAAELTSPDAPSFAVAGWPGGRWAQLVSKGGARCGKKA